jgi:hypothetical protein
VTPSKSPNDLDYGSVTQEMSWPRGRRTTTVNFGAVVQNIPGALTDNLVQPLLVNFFPSGTAIDFGPGCISLEAAPQRISSAGFDHGTGVDHSQRRLAHQAEPVPRSFCNLARNSRWVA